jgi:hypothetical protein
MLDVVIDDGEISVGGSEDDENCVCFEEDGKGNGDEKLGGSLNDSVGQTETKYPMENTFHCSVSGNKLIVELGHRKPIESSLEMGILKKVSFGTVIAMLEIVDELNEMEFLISELEKFRFHSP